MKKLSLVMIMFVAIMLSGIVGKAQNLTGNWQNPGGVIFKIKQVNELVSINASAYGNEYIMAGFKYPGKNYLHCVCVVYKNGTVLHKIYVKLKIVDNKTIEDEWECIEAGGGVTKGQTGKETWLLKGDE